MGNTITTADLLAVQKGITDSHRDALTELRDDFRTEIHQVRSTQTEQGLQIAALRAVVEERTKTGAAFRLTSKQKAALLAGGVSVLGAVAEGARHLFLWVAAIGKHGPIR